MKWCPPACRQKRPGAAGKSPRGRCSLTWRTWEFPFLPYSFPWPVHANSCESDMPKKDRRCIICIVGADDTGLRGRGLFIYIYICLFMFFLKKTCSEEMKNDPENHLQMVLICWEMALKIPHWTSGRGLAERRSCSKWWLEALSRCDATIRFKPKAKGQLTSTATQRLFDLPACKLMELAATISLNKCP